MEYLGKYKWNKQDFRLVFKSSGGRQATGLKWRAARARHYVMYDVEAPRPSTGTC